MKTVLGLVRLFACATVAVAVAGGLSGCAYSRYDASTTTAGGGSLQVRGDGRVFAGIIAIGVLIEGARAFPIGGAPRDQSDPPGWGARTAEPDPARRVNVQDCTRPVDLTAGNLYCK